MFHHPQSTGNKTSVLSKDSLAAPLLTPDKSQLQKSTESSLLETNEHLGPEDYRKLQELLQTREASLRQHAKHSHQLRIYIEDLEQKNRALQKTNNQILIQYKTEVVSIKKQNDDLRRMMKKIQSENIDIKRQLESALSKIPERTKQNQSPSQRIKSQSIIKALGTQDPVYSKIITGNHSPILQNCSNRHHSQSREKIQVTIKSVRGEKQRSAGRNQKNMGTTGLVKLDNQHDREIKKLIDIKKLQNSTKNPFEDLKLQKLFGQKIEKIPSHKRRSSDPMCDSRSIRQEKQVQEEKMTVKKLTKQFQAEYAQTKQKNLNKNSEKNPLSMRKRKNNHDLIKLGHYVQTSPIKAEY